MVADAHLGNKFWGYGMLEATHMLNRMPSRAHEKRSPIKVWTGVKHSITHFRVFGSPTYVLVTAETRRKLDTKSVTRRFVKYEEDQRTRVYKLYHKEMRKTITSQDMVFDKILSERAAEKSLLKEAKGLAAPHLVS